LKEREQRISSSALVAVGDLGRPLARAGALERLAQRLDVVDDPLRFRRRNGKDGLEETFRTHESVDEVKVRIFLGAEVNADASRLLRRRHFHR
jgi:hypothetical protein